jgi:hypothetical protein
VPSDEGMGEAADNFEVVAHKERQADQQEWLLNRSAFLLLAHPENSDSLVSCDSENDYKNYH